MVVPTNPPVFQRDFAHVMLSAREASRLALRTETLRCAQAMRHTCLVVILGRLQGSLNRHQPKTRIQDSVGARVVERRGVGLYGRSLGDCVARGCRVMLLDNGRPSGEGGRP